MRHIFILLISLVLLSTSLFAQESGPKILLMGIAEDKSSREFFDFIEYYHNKGDYYYDLYGEPIFKWINADDTDWEQADLSVYDIIWIHNNDSLPSNHSPEFYEAMLQYVDAGGSLLLTQHAMEFLNLSGLEPVPVQHRLKASEDNGYGRMLGFHAFRHHPIFDGLHGGAYIWKPPHDTTVSQYGFFDDQVPENGKVVAVDWDYIFVRESSKLVVEYEHGRGKILGIGAYYSLLEPNLNNMHYDAFYENIFNYLSAKEITAEEHYWLYGKQNIEPLDFVTLRQIIPPGPEKWDIARSPIALNRDRAKREYCEVAGKRMLVAAYEPGGIFEVWAHPFMAFRDYKVTLHFGDSSVLLNELHPHIEVAPEYVIRTYSLGTEITLREILTVSPDLPVGVIHYEYSGPGAKLGIQYKSNMRLMWPYSGNVLKTLKYGWDPGINATEFNAPEGGIVTFVGSNGTPISKFVGPANMYAPSYPPGEIVPGEYDHESDTLFEVIAGQLFELSEEDQLDIIFAAGSEGRPQVLNAYMETLRDPKVVCQRSAQHYRELFDNMLGITTPDENFNQGYQWALAATDRFFVETPGVGTSLVAGYNGTDRGWDGAHKINGRPGYAWYFGRDAVWSAFAVLDYGDYEGVKDVLNMLINYQDLNGKIFHELSTSGFVHYDASDATPLFIILAGRYLEYSGDTTYIRSIWNALNMAMFYCEMTDSDEDGLIENTNVGHGWVEGGHLFGSHTSLYLASLWMSATKTFAEIANTLDFVKQSNYYFSRSAEVSDLLFNKFYDNESGFLYQGIYKDGSFHREQSIMPSVSLYMDVRVPDASPMLRAWGSHEYSSDWGVRMASINSEHYHPRGYHSGAVWPLYTGWVALAEYGHDRPLQGYTHIMNNLNNYHDFSLGYTEEVLNGEKYSPSGVCPHQCWSETMVLQPIIEGMLGIIPLAAQDFLIFSPVVNFSWKHMEVKNIKVGNKTLDWEMKREKNSSAYSFACQDNLAVEFGPLFMHGTDILSVSMNGEDYSFDTIQRSCGVELYLPEFHTGNTKIVVEHRGGISLIPPVERPSPNEESRGIRIIDDSWEDNTYTISLEGAAGMQYELEVINNFGAPVSVEGATYREEGNRLFLTIDFPAMNKGYKGRVIKINF